MATSVTLTKDLMVGGVAQTAGTVVSVPDDTAEYLIFNKLATRIGQPVSDFSQSANWSVGPRGQTRGLIGPRRQIIPVGVLPYSQGGVFCDWQPGTGTLSKISADAGDAFALDSSVLFDGLPAAKCTFSNAATGTFIGQFAFTNPVSLKGFKSIQVPVLITCNESASGSLEMTVDNIASAFDYLNSRVLKNGVSVLPCGQVYDLHFK